MDQLSVYHHYTAVCSSGGLLATFCRTVSWLPSKTLILGPSGAVYGTYHALIKFVVPNIYVILESLAAVSKDIIWQHFHFFIHLCAFYQTCSCLLEFAAWYTHSCATKGKCSSGIYIFCSYHISIVYTICALNRSASRLVILVGIVWGAPPWRGCCDVPFSLVNYHHLGLVSKGNKLYLNSSIN